MIDLVKSLDPTKVSIKQMTGYIEEPHTAMSIGQTKSRKTHLVLELMEKRIQ